MKEHNEMVAAQLANWLSGEIKELEGEDNGLCTFFSAASRNLNSSDFNKLVRAAKSELKRLEKKANGCPVSPWKWQEHYNG